MQMTFSPEHNHFYVRMLNNETNAIVTLFREVRNPDAEFEQTFDFMSHVATTLAKDANIFETCFDALPVAAVRTSIEKFIEGAPSSDAVRVQAAQHITDAFELQKMVDDHESVLRDLAVALTLSDEELRAGMRIHVIELKDVGGDLGMGVCWGPRDIKLLLCAIPSKALEYSLEDLVKAKAHLVEAGMVAEGMVAEGCPYCESGVPHPEGIVIPGEHPPAGETKKTILH